MPFTIKVKYMGEGVASPSILMKYHSPTTEMLLQNFVVAIATIAITTRNYIIVKYFPTAVLSPPTTPTTPNKADEKRVVSQVRFSPYVYCVFQVGCP